MARSTYSATEDLLGFEAGTEPPGKPVTMPARQGNPAVPPAQPSTNATSSNTTDVEVTVHSAAHSSMVLAAKTLLRGDAVVPTPAEPSFNNFNAEKADRAHVWRAQLQTVFDIAEKPAALRADLVAGIEERLWARLEDSGGRHFETFAAFCRAPTPLGLGRPERDVMRHLGELIGARAAKIATVAPGRQGRKDPLPAPGAGGSPEPAPRSESRRRAILRAAEPVQQLYKRGGINEKEAALLGKRGATPVEAAKIAELAASASDLMTGWKSLDDAGREELRQTFSRRVRAALTPAPPDPLAFAEQFLARFVTFSIEDQETIAHAIVLRLPPVSPPSTPTEPTAPPAPPMSETKAETASRKATATKAANVKPTVVTVSIGAKPMAVTINGAPSPLRALSIEIAREELVKVLADTANDGTSSSPGEPKAIDTDRRRLHLFPTIAVGTVKLVIG